MTRMIFVLAALVIAALLLGGMAFGATLLFPYMRQWANDPTLRFVPAVMVAVATVLLGATALKNRQDTGA